MRYNNEKQRAENIWLNVHFICSLFKEKSDIYEHLKKKKKKNRKEKKKNKEKSFSFRILIESKPLPFTLLMPRIHVSKPILRELLG